MRNTTLSVGQSFNSNAYKAESCSQYGIGFDSETNITKDRDRNDQPKRQN